MLLHVEKEPYKIKKKNLVSLVLKVAKSVLTYKIVKPVFHITLKNLKAYVFLNVQKTAINVILIVLINVLMDFV